MFWYFNFKPINKQGILYNLLILPYRITDELYIQNVQKIISNVVHLKGLNNERDGERW